MRTSDRLLARLRDFGLDLPEGSRLIRTRASGSSRSLGAWSWFAEGPTTRELGIGSQYPMRDILKAEHLATAKDVHGDITVYPVEPLGPVQSLS